MARGPCTGARCSSGAGTICTYVVACEGAVEESEDQVDSVVRRSLEQRPTHGDEMIVEGRGVGAVPTQRTRRFMEEPHTERVAAVA
jgi:hypothetical protein